MVVEILFVQKDNELFMALGFYADKIELAGGASEASATDRRETVLATIRAQLSRDCPDRPGRQ